MKTKHWCCSSYFCSGIFYKCVVTEFWRR